MANKTVVLNSYLFNGTSGLTLLLLSPTDGSIGNGSGDTLTAGSNGQFTATVTEAIAGWWKVVVLNGSSPILEGGSVYFAADAEGTYVVDDPTIPAMQTTVSSRASQTSVDAKPSLSQIESSTVIAKEATLDAMKGSGWASTDSLKEIKGAAGVVIVPPISVQSPDRVIGTTIVRYVREVEPLRLPVWSGPQSNIAVDLEAARPLRFVVSDATGRNLLVIEDGGISVDNTNYFRITPNLKSVQDVMQGSYCLSKANTEAVLGFGVWDVRSVARKN